MENRGRVDGDGRRGGVEGLMGESEEEEGVGLGGSDGVDDERGAGEVVGMTDGNDKKN